MTPAAAVARAQGLIDLHPPPDRLRDDVRAGLGAEHKVLPPKYFYDEAGALLFERITQLDEYYPTRTELGILERNMAEIAALVGPAANVVEFGSGSGRKTRMLLRALRSPASYVPVDISRAQLLEFAASLAAEIPGLKIVPVCADYTAEWALPGLRRDGHAGRTVAFFPGSTIGNFEAGDVVPFLRRVRSLCGPGGGLLLGVDLHKGREVLEPAYDDAEGVTAAFNLNLLVRINRECGTDFDLSAFRHHAFYDEERRRIEMRLVCGRRCSVTLPGVVGEPPEVFDFHEGDFITTEYSHKYTLAGFRSLAEEAGWTVERVWTDTRPWFSVFLLKAGQG